MKLRCVQQIDSTTLYVDLSVYQLVHPALSQLSLSDPTSVQLHFDVRVTITCFSLVAAVHDTVFPARHIHTHRLMQVLCILYIYPSNYLSLSQSCGRCSAPFPEES